MSGPTGCRSSSRSESLGSAAARDPAGGLLLRYHPTDVCLVVAVAINPLRARVRDGAVGADRPVPLPAHVNGDKRPPSASQTVDQPQPRQRPPSVVTIASSRLVMSEGGAGDQVSVSHFDADTSPALERRLSPSEMIALQSSPLLSPFARVWCGRIDKDAAPASPAADTAASPTALSALPDRHRGRAPRRSTTPQRRFVCANVTARPFWTETRCPIDRSISATQTRSQARDAKSPG